MGWLNGISGADDVRANLSVRGVDTRKNEHIPEGDRAAVLIVGCRIGRGDSENIICAHTGLRVREIAMATIPARQRRP